MLTAADLFGQPIFCGLLLCLLPRSSQLLIMLQPMVRYVPSVLPAASLAASSNGSCQLVMLFGTFGFDRDLKTTGSIFLTDNYDIRFVINYIDTQSPPKRGIPYGIYIYIYIYIYV